MGASGAKAGASEDEVEKYRISPLEEVLQAEYATNIDIHMRLEDVAKPGDLRIIIYSKYSFEPAWRKLDNTEVSKDRSASPSFSKVITIQFQVELLRLLRFEVYRIRDVNYLEDLSMQKFVGVAECSVCEVMVARGRGGQNSGWLVKSLKEPIPQPGPEPGRLCLWGEEDAESKKVLGFVIAAANIKSTDIWKRKADPYFVLNRTIVHEADPEEGIDGDIDLVPVYRTEVARRTDRPRFKRVELTAAQLVGSLAADHDIVIETFDWFRVSEDKYVGESITTVGEINRAFRESRPLVLNICMREGKRRLLADAKREEEEEKRRGTASKVSKASRSITGSRSRSVTSSRKGTRVGSRAITRDSHASSRKASRLASRSSKGSASQKSRKSSTTSPGSPSAGRSSGGLSTSSKKSKGDKPAIFGKVVGSLVLEDIGVMRGYTFLDYVRGGMEITMSVAVDLTRSNGCPDNELSQHHLDAEGTDSAYGTAIRRVGEAMCPFDADDKYSVYGFGAKIPPSRTVTSDCFSLTGDFWDPEVRGIDGIIHAYKQALHVCHLHGPTKLHEVIHLGINMSKPYADAMTPPVNGVDMKFFVLLILTDGEIHEQEKVIEALTEAADMPLAVVIVGVGDSEFDFLRGLVETVRVRRQALDPKRNEKLLEEQQQQLAVAMNASKAKGKKGQQEGPRPQVVPRDVVRFVAYNDYRDRIQEIGAAALSGLHKEVVSYYTGKKVAPRNLDKLEDPSGNPLPKVIPQAPGRSDTNKSGGNSRTSTKQSGSGSRNTSPAPSRAVSTLSSAEPKAEKKANEKLKNLPPHLKEERDRLIKAAESLGYPRPQIYRTLQDGVPAASIEVMLDCMLNGGYGKNPVYKVAAEAALPRHTGTTKLPGQPDEKTPSGMPMLLAQSFADFDFSASNGSTPNGISRTPSLSPKGLAITTSRGFSMTSPSRERRSSPSSRSPSPSRMASRADEVDNSRRGTRDGSLHKRSSTHDSLGSIGSGMGQPSRPSKGILKTSSRAPSMERITPRGRRSKSMSVRGPTKESIGSETDSLRAAATVTFEDDHSPPGEPTCGICFKAPIEVENYPCGHRHACRACAAELLKVRATCLECNEVVQKVIPIAGR